MDQVQGQAQRKTIHHMLTRADIKRIKDDSGRVKELENSLSIALDNVDKYQRENKDLKDQVKEANKINQLHQELCEKLKSDLARAKEEHQYDNLVHQKELESLRKK